MMGGFSLIPPRANEFASLAQLVEAIPAPVDDLTPEQYAILDAALARLGPYVHRVQTNEQAAVRSGRAKAPKAPRAVRAREEGWWSLGAARKVVRQRSGGDCELRSGKCQGRANDVHHAFGRRGDDPHHPDGLLHLCGHGNIDGCHGWVHQTAEGKAAARAVCAEFAASRLGQVRP